MCVCLSVIPLGFMAPSAPSLAHMNDDAMAPLFPDIHPAERHRFLAARDGNLEQAVEMLQSHLMWRSAHELALANLEDPPLLIGSTLCAMGPNNLYCQTTCHHSLRLNILRGTDQNLRGRAAPP